MSKTRKEHRKKVDARNKRIKDDQNRMKKLLTAAYLQKTKQQNEEKISE